MRPLYTRTFLATLLVVNFAHAFIVTPQYTKKLFALSLGAAATSRTTTHRVEQVLNDNRVLDVASFRNGVCNPAMMVANQQAKQDQIDRTASALDGLKIGLLIIGPPFALYQWYSTGSVQDGLVMYMSLGVTSGVMLAINNYMGKGVYVPSEAEATNRIIVDYAEGLKRQQDVGFVALSDDNAKYTPCHGVMACVDAQLRNSPSSPSGVTSISGYPPHLHIKNMLVHDDMRRQGVGKDLMVALERYATEQTDAELLTLEVDESNTAAVKLYENVGFALTKNPTTFTKRKFMVKNLKQDSLKPGSRDSVVGSALNV